MAGSDFLAFRAAHQEPGAFLRALILHLDREDRRQLLDSLTKAEREQKCIHRAMFLLLVLLMSSLAGLGYCAILLPEVFMDPTHLLMRSLFVLVLGSLLSQAAFFGYLLSHRAVVNRLHTECRRVVLALAQFQLNTAGAPAFTVDGYGELPGASASSPA